MRLSILSNLNLVHDRAYIVYFDDTPYYGIGYVDTEIGESGIVFYKDASSTSDDNFVGHILAEGDSQTVTTKSGYLNPNQTYTLKIALAEDLVEKIDPIYLPNGLGGLPPVTAADNGKIIEVVDGEYKLVDIASSSIAAYIQSLLGNAN